MKSFYFQLLFIALVAVLAVVASGILSPHSGLPPDQSISLREQSLPVQNGDTIGFAPPPQDHASSSPTGGSRALHPPVKPVKKKPLALPHEIPNIALIPTTPPPVTPPPPGLSDQEFYDRNHDAVVQVFCATPGEYLSASGVIINERGLVLTNAHVAAIVEKVGRGNCHARHGNPAEAFADLEMIFSPDTQAKISGTEVPQHDFAFLRIVKWREPFRVANLSLQQASSGATLLTLGYPSEFLEGTTASNNANLVFSLLSVAGLADFDDDPRTADGYLFHGGIVLQQGSSGTPIFDRSGDVLGVIFATTKASTTAEREGVALMTASIDRELKKEIGVGLLEFVSTH